MESYTPTPNYIFNSLQKILGVFPFLLRSKKIFNPFCPFVPFINIRSKKMKSWTLRPPSLNKMRYFPPSWLTTFPPFPSCHLSLPCHYSHFATSFPSHLSHLANYLPSHLSFPPSHLTTLPSTNKVLQNNNIMPLLSLPTLFFTESSQYQNFKAI